MELPKGNKMTKYSNCFHSANSPSSTIALFNRNLWKIPTEGIVYRYIQEKHIFETKVERRIKKLG